MTSSEPIWFPLSNFISPIALADGHTDSVRIRIRRDDDVGIRFFGQLDPHCECFRIFRIRRFHGRKSRIELFPAPERFRN